MTSPWAHAPNTASALASFQFPFLHIILCFSSTKNVEHPLPNFLLLHRLLFLFPSTDVAAESPQLAATLLLFRFSLGLYYCVIVSPPPISASSSSSELTVVANNMVS